MFKVKFTVSIFIIITFLIITSIIKNKTRILEKKIFNLNTEVLLKNKYLNESQLDFFYLSSPTQIEKRLNIIGLNNYQPIKYSNIYFDVNDFLKIHNKISTTKNLNEKKIQKKQ